MTRLLTHKVTRWVCMITFCCWLSPASATPTALDEADLARFTEVSVAVNPPQATVRLEMKGGDRARGLVHEWELDALSWRYLDKLARRGVRHLKLEGRPAGTHGRWLALDQLLDPARAPSRRAHEPVWADSGSAATLNAAPQVTGVQGALSGKVVYLSPGHGWYWSDVLKRWATQRGNTHDIVEDFVNMEAALHYLVPMLRNAGATVVGVRELDIHSWMGLVDDGDDADFITQGDWTFSQGGGFATGLSPYKGDVNPFANGGASTAAVATTSTAFARWSFDVPTPGLYTVYVTYTAGQDRSQDAHFVLKTAAGERHIRVDQTRHGQTWVTLAQLYLHGKTVVELHNDTEGPLDRVVVADAVRIGGGMGEMVRGNGAPPAKGPTSGRPRWEECSRYYAQFAGAPPTVWNVSSSDNKDDVSTRARFAAWHHEQGEDALYVSWHSNAGSDTARGTSVYVYGPNPPNGSKDYKGTKGSTELGKALQKHIVGDLRATWEPDWKDRGLYSAYFGEVNPKSNPEMPAALIEGAFHSTKADADALRAPRFRMLMSRAIRKAIIHYFAERDGVTVKLPPSAPAAVQLDSDGTLSWSAGPASDIEGHAALSYRVQTSTDGRHFNDGEPVNGTTWTLQMPEDNEPIFARVVAVNAGGVSFPSSVVGASAGCSGEAEVLVIDGFTRLSPAQLLSEDLTPFALKQVDRLFQERMNTFDYLIEHVSALANAGHAVASLQRSAWQKRSVGEKASWLYWASGEQGMTDGVMTSEERALVEAWLTAQPSRSIVITGSEVVWTLSKLGGAASEWMSTWLGADLVSDDAQSYEVEAEPGGPLKWGGGKLDDGSGLTYHVDWPDSLKLTGATALLRYGSASAGEPQVAATYHEHGGAKVVTVGFPIEALQSGRESLVAALSVLLAAPAQYKEGCVGERSPPHTRTGAEVRTIDAGATAGDLGPSERTDDPGAAASSATDGCGCHLGHRSQPRPVAICLVALCIFAIVSRRRKAALH